METPSDSLAAEASLASVSTFLQSDNGTSSPVSPEGRSSLSDSVGSLSSKVAVSPPHTIPEGKPLENSLDQLLSPLASPTSTMADEWPSRASSTRAIRTSRPVRVPTADGRRVSRRSQSGRTSVSPAHAFLSSWGNRDGAVNEPVAEPKQDDEGQPIPDSNYIIGRTINQGGFGVVKEAHTITSSGNTLVKAVKIVRKSIPGTDEALNERAQLELEHEMSVWRFLKHRHILNLDAVYDTDFATYCIMDLNVGGTLYDMVRKTRSAAPENGGRKALDPRLAKSYAYQLASALRYLHEDIRVCHRDIKLENCLIDMTVLNADTQGGHLRLCDFGLADFLSSDRSIDEGAPETLVSGMLSAAGRPPPTHRPTTSSVIGTLEYASPKGLSVNRKLFETAGDVWAFGVIVYALCTGDLPFKHAMPSKTVEMILQAEWDEQALLNAAAGGNEVREMVVGCLEKDIDLRMTIGDALRSAWFEDCVEPDEVDGGNIWG